MFFFQLNLGFLSAFLLITVFPSSPLNFQSSTLQPSPQIPLEHRAASHHGDHHHPPLLCRALCQVGGKSFFLIKTLRTGSQLGLRRLGLRRIPFHCVEWSLWSLPAPGSLGTAAECCHVEAEHLIHQETQSTATFASLFWRQCDWLSSSFGFSDVFQCDPGYPRRPLHGSSSVAKSHTRTQHTLTWQLSEMLQRKHKERKDQKPRRETETPTCMLSSTVVSDSLWLHQL